MVLRMKRGSPSSSSTRDKHLLSVGCEMNEMRRGELKFGSVERMGALVIPQAIGIFHRKFPNISINVIEGDSISLEEDVAAGRIDMAIVPAPLKNDSLNYTVFNRDPYLVAIPAGHPLCDKAYSKPGEELPFIAQEDLKGATIIVTSPKKRTRQIFDILLDRLGGEYNIALELNNIETVIRFVANSIGISIVPSLFAKVYEEGERILYCQMEPSERLYHEWAIIYSDRIEDLTRPSRELCRIISDECFIRKEMR